MVPWSCGHFDCADHYPKQEQIRSKSFASSNFLNKRFTGISLAPRGSEVESSEDIRGPLGLSLLHEPSETLIDFVFVHGLRGGSRKTWSKTADPGHFWPKEWLPREPKFKNVRIHSFGYSSDWGERKGNQITIHDFGQALLGDMQNSPCLAGAGRNTPIVMIGHSMGGVVIKKMLLLAKQDPNHKALASRIHSMFFLATPHRGADSAQLLSNLLRVTVSHGSKPYVDNLMPKSDAIQVINDGFRNAYQGIQLWSFFETVKTSLGLIVEKDSAVLELPGERVQLSNADHRHVCKFDDPSDSNYCTLRNAFVSTIESIETTWFSARSENYQDEMRLLSHWLGLVEPPEADLTSVADLQIEGSCTWLTASETFQAWQSGPNNQPKYYWLYGDPATGKSTLASHVIKHLQVFNGDCSYFFFKHGSSGKSNIAELLCSLAWQMAASNSDIRQKIVGMEREGLSVDKTDERSIWRTVFVTRVFRTELRKPHYWVIDGVDECTNQASLFPLLSKIDRHFPLRIFVTSRPSLTIERSFSREKIPVIQEWMRLDRLLVDIALFVRAHAQYMPVDSDEEQEKLVQIVIEKSHGNFLWTKLVVTELEEAVSEQRINEILDSVPEEIDNLYSRILGNIAASPRNLELVMTILRWTVCVSRALTVGELREALRLDLGETLPQLERTAGSLCGNLVYVDPQGRVRLTHQTVREYLLVEEKRSEFAIQRSQAHSRMAQVCLEYLSGDEMRTARHRHGSLTAARQNKRSAFADYAAKHFSDHVVKCSASTESHLSGLNTFLQSNSLTWIEVVALSQDLGSLAHTAKNLKKFLARRAKYQPPLGIEIQNISEWADDLIHIVAQFGRALLTSPLSIQFLIPPICPRDTVMHKTFGEYARGLRLSGLSESQWDDRLCCIIFQTWQTLSVACRDEKYALGLSDGTIHIYDEASYQEKMVLEHGEPVRCLNFASLNVYLASAGRKSISVFETSTGTLMWRTKVTDQPIALEFSEDATTLMAATRANSMSFWAVDTGQEIDLCQFSDITEEDHSEYHYQRPPTHAMFSPGLNLLGVVYRQRPVSLWDLEDKSFIGQFHREGASYPGPFTQDFLFNPNPEICRAAVLYQDGAVVIFDPWTQQTDNTRCIGANVLAASPDGILLASGSGDGVIKILEFETLKMLYQINSHEEAIKALSFNSSGLRFLDIRGKHCNIWEPSVLLRQTGSGDDSTADFSESVTEGPEYIASRMSDEDLAITACTVHHDGDHIFCGRENGTVAVYSAVSGEVLRDLFTHSKDVAVDIVTWCESADLLLTLDRSGDFVLRKILITKWNPVEVGNIWCHGKISGIVQQMLMRPDGTRLLISTSEATELWNIADPKVSNTYGSLDLPTTLGRWSQHPKRLDQLLLINSFQAFIYDWDSLHSQKNPKAVNLRLSAPSSTSAKQLVSSSHGKNICAIYSATELLAAKMPPSLRLWPTVYLDYLHSATEACKPAASYDNVAKSIKTVIGTYRSLLVYLDHSGWVCSINIDDVTIEKFYTRHFFIPPQWHSTLGKMSMLVTKKGAVVMAIKHELAVFQNGLEFEEKVGFEGTTVAAKVSMRSMLKRGRSDPL